MSPNDGEHGARVLRFTRLFLYSGMAKSWSHAMEMARQRVYAMYARQQNG